MDESRRQFEEWLKEDHLYGDDELEWQEWRNCYSIYWVHLAFQAWQASRQAIEITSPEPVTTREALDAGYMGDYAAGRDDVIEDTLKVVRAAGLKIKGE